MFLVVKAPKGTTLEVPEIEDEKEEYPHQLFFNSAEAQGEIQLYLVSDQNSKVT
jgi:hypothetical protein